MPTQRFVFFAPLPYASAFIGAAWLISHVLHPVVLSCPNLLQWKLSYMWTPTGREKAVRNWS